MQLKAFIAGREWHGRRYLISPLLDFLMVGGAGLILALTMFLWLPDNVNNDAAVKRYSGLLAAFVIYHVFAINFPHFAASYQITYTRLPYLRKSAGMPRAVRWRYWFALVGFPILYVAYCIIAFSLQPDQSLILFGLLVNLMFLTVGWHYCKQCFGILMVLSVLKGLYFTTWERRLLLIHAGGIWWLSWMHANIVISRMTGDVVIGRRDQFFGVPYHKFSVLEPRHIELYNGIMHIGYAGLLCLFCGGIWAILRSACRMHKLPSFTGACGYFMAYPLLMIGSYFHPLWLTIAPAVHSLQYLLFVLAYRRGEVQQKYPKKAEVAEAERRHIARIRWHAMGSFFAVAALIGAVQFSWLPHALDALLSPNDTYHTPLLFVMVVYVFVNVHHYFIDNVIWRKENPEIARNLMAMT